MSVHASHGSTEYGEEMATAVGLFALGEADLGEAAEQAGVSAWELHEVLTDAGVVAPEHRD